MNFGMALERLKRGVRVARAGWNGKGMWIAIVRPYDVPGDSSPGNKVFVKIDITDRVPRPPELADDVEFTVGDMLYGQKEWEQHGVKRSSLYSLAPWIGMKTADDCFVPWLASQTDLLAEDWEIVT